jgi:hypothetical protein
MSFFTAAAGRSRKRLNNQNFVLVDCNVYIADF